jgi:hypothetical protein
MRFGYRTIPVFFFCLRNFVFVHIILFGSVVDPDPKSDPDPVRSETFCRIRIRSRIRNKSFRIRIRAALIRN